MGFVVSGARESEVQRSATSFRAAPSRHNEQAKQTGALEKEVNTITSFLMRLTSEPGIGGRDGIRTHVPLEGDNRISSAGRYNHFDTLPYNCLFYVTLLWEHCQIFCTR